MNVRNYLTVTVHRVDESGHEAGTETLDAFSVEVGPAGQLIIQGTGDISVTFGRQHGADTKLNVFQGSAWQTAASSATAESLKDGPRAEQRIFFFNRENGAWLIIDVMASGGRSLNTSRPACL